MALENVFLIFEHVYEEKSKPDAKMPDQKKATKTPRLITSNPSAAPVVPPLVIPAPVEPPPVPLVFCYPTSRLLLQSTAPHSPSTVIYMGNQRHNGRISAQFRLECSQQVLGVPAGQFVVLTLPLSGGASSVSRPLFPAGPSDAQGSFRVFWEAKQQDNQQSEANDYTSVINSSQTFNINTKWLEIIFLNHFSVLLLAERQFFACQKFREALQTMLSETSVRIQGPFGAFLYRSNGWFTHQQTFYSPSTTKQYKNVLFIGMSFGMLPFYTILDQASRERSLKTEFTLLQINLEKRDFWMTEEIDKIHYSSPSTLVAYQKLHLEMSMYSRAREELEKAITDHCPLPGSDVLTVICAPPLLVDHYILPALNATGFSDRSSLYVFGGTEGNETFECDDDLLKCCLLK